VRNPSAERIKHRIGEKKNRPWEKPLFFHEKVEKNPDRTKTRSQKPEFRSQKGPKTVPRFDGMAENSTANKVTKRAFEPG
jgi:hypothetical protein